MMGGAGMVGGAGMIGGSGTLGGAGMIGGAGMMNVPGMAGRPVLTGNIIPASGIGARRSYIPPGGMGMMSFRAPRTGFRLTNPIARLFG